MPGAASSWTGVSRRALICAAVKETVSVYVESRFSKNDIAETDDVEFGYVQMVM